jgi:hypothetical protein
LCAAFAFGITPGNANTSPPANIIVISVRLVSFLTISFFKHCFENVKTYKGICWHFRAPRIEIVLKMY